MSLGGARPCGGTYGGGIKVWCVPHPGCRLTATHQPPQVVVPTELLAFPCPSLLCLGVLPTCFPLCPFLPFSGVFPSSLPVFLPRAGMGILHHSPSTLPHTSISHPLRAAALLPLFPSEVPRPSQP